MIEAAFTDGVALICVIPSKSNNGVYLVKVSPSEEDLTIQHSCPAQKFGYECDHVKEAIKCFHAWQWWKKPLPVKVKQKFVVLDPNWDQVPVPGEIMDTMLHVIEGDSNNAS